MLTISTASVRCSTSTNKRQRRRTDRYLMILRFMPGLPGGRGCQRRRPGRHADAAANRELSGDDHTDGALTVRRQLLIHGRAYRR